MTTGAHKLNQIETYEQLLQRAKRNGYLIESIIYNGYTSTTALQEIQDAAIHARTELRLNSEIDEQKNRLIDLKLESENQRLNLETELNRLRCEFDEKMSDLKGKFALDLKKASHNADLKIKEIELRSMIEMNAEKNAIKEDYLKSLKKLDIDINRYEIELSKSEHQVSRLYELIN